MRGFHGFSDDYSGIAMSVLITERELREHPRLKGRSDDVIKSAMKKIGMFWNTEMEFEKEGFIDRLLDGVRDSYNNGEEM